MKIACLVKFVPNVDNYKYDYERNVIVRENSPMTLNPDDAAALAYGLELRQSCRGSGIEVVGMAPASVLPLAKNILRAGADNFTLLCDRMFAGSDTFCTAMTISKYLQGRNFDLILSGSHTLDGGTSQVPAQLSRILGIPQMSEIVKVRKVDCDKQYAEVEVAHEDRIDVYRMELPAIVSLTKQSGYKMPFVRFQDIDLNVDDRIQIVSGKDLKLTENETGLSGSKTMVKRTYDWQESGRKTIFVKADAAGMDIVYRFLKDKGYANG